MRFDTRLVHVGQEPEPGVGGVVPPLHLASTYERGVQDPLRYFYSRTENPTRENLERCLASLEDAQAATVYASGQAAAAAALLVLAPSGRVLCSDDVYGGTHELFTQLRGTGVDVEYADLADPEVLAGLRFGDFSLVWLETPSNPMLKLVDVEAVVRRARRAGVPVLVDNTLAGPALQQPLRLGADVSLYSTTKAAAGHLDVLGGALVYDRAELHERFLAHRGATGAVPGAFDCFLVHRGLKTLAVRTRRQVETAAFLADLLGREPTVGAVRYPGLPTHPGHELAARQMTAPGSMLSFDYLGDPAKLLDRVEVFTCAVSLGGVRSLIELPASMTHRPVPPEIRARLGITDSLVRLSIGIEDPADLAADLTAALRGESGKDGRS
ncbi:trans-sulfuration enzyme family protein [Amycolatopsis sp. NPDC005003]